VSLPRLAIRRPVATAMVVLLVLLLGAVSFSKLALDLMPDIDYPVAVVATTYSGAGPQEIEKLITRPLEEAVGSVNNVRLVGSESSEGMSLIIAEFNWGTDMDFACLDLREKVDRVKRFLPDDAEEPTFLRFSPEMMPTLQLALSGEGDLAELKQLAEDTIKGRLERLDGVASVSVTGGTTREVEVVCDPGKLQLHGISPRQIVQALGTENLNLPAGDVTEGTFKLTLRAVGEYTSIDDIRNVVLTTPQGGRLRLADVAAVSLTDARRESISRLDGRPSVGLMVYKRTEANTVQVADRVLDEVRRMQPELPLDVEFADAYNTADYIKRTLQTVMNNAITGALLAMLILLLFLRSYRTALVVAVAIPVSIIATFSMIHLSGLTINLMTLGGLALGVGMLVDTSIVVIENIFRHREEGKAPEEAAAAGAEQVATAVTASTLTTLAVFLPVIFLQGIASEIFRQLAYTVSFALSASLIVSLTVIPLLAARYLSRKPVGRRREGGFIARLGDRTAGSITALTRGYRRGLSWALNHRGLVLLTAGVTFVLSLALLPLVGSEFIPNMDSGRVQVSVTLPSGKTLQETESVMSRIEDLLSRDPDIESVLTSVGTSGQMMFSTGSGSEIGEVLIRLVPRGERSRPTEQFVRELRQELSRVPGAACEVLLMSGMTGAMAGAAIQVDVKGDDLDVLSGLAQDIARRVEQVEGAAEVSTSLDEARPELQVRVNRSRAAAYGLGAAQVATALRTAVEGDVATRYRTGGEEIDVRVRLPEETVGDIAAIRGLPLISPQGGVIRLDDVADIVVARGPTVITRDGQVREASVMAEVAGRNLGAVTDDIQRIVDAVPLPEGYTVDIGGQAREMTEAFSTLWQALALAVVLVYAVMAAQFESLVHPVTIMVSVPLAFTGAALALVLTGRTLNIATFIGVIALAGIVVNNAIVFLDYLGQLRRSGMARREALLETGVARLRPILMTAATTVLGLIPLALGLGDGGEVEAPLATVIIGGLTLSTVLTLVVVPCVYELFDDLAGRVWRRRPARSVAGGTGGPS